MTQLSTSRLTLVPFRDEHAEGLNAINADPEVMRYLSGRPETLDETRAVIERVKRRWIEFGYAWWSVIETGSGQIVGAGCVQHLRRDASPNPDPACPLEIGWRLRRDVWGRGFATEAAQAMAGFAFDTLRADELYAVCDPDNVASAAVMKRLGMQDCGLQSWYSRLLRAHRIEAGPWRAADRNAPRG